MPGTKSWGSQYPEIEEAEKERQKRMQEDLPYPIKSGGGELGRLLRERDEYPVQKKPVEDY